jgi:hypothetical protein
MLFFVSYLIMLSVSSLHCVGWDEVERILIEVLSQHLPPGTVENHNNLRVVSALVDIRTKSLANTHPILPLGLPQ